MNIDHAASLEEVRVIAAQGEFSDVVKKIFWKISFYDVDNPSDVSCDAVVETYLDTENLDANTYIGWENITQANILQFALDAEGGESFIDALLDGGHRDNLEKQKGDLALQQKDIALIERE